MYYFREGTIFYKELDTFRIIHAFRPVMLNMSRVLKITQVTTEWVFDLMTQSKHKHYANMYFLCVCVHV